MCGGVGVGGGLLTDRLKLLLKENIFVIFSFFIHAKMSVYLRHPLTSYIM